MIRVEKWGRVPYREAWDRQKAMVTALLEATQNRNAGDAADEAIADNAVVITEHPHVYTLGFHGNAANMLLNSERLAATGAELVQIERGGDITYHGPGQLVVYPVISLHSFRIGVKGYIELLEQSVIELLALYDIAATCNGEAIGVWLDWGEPTARKICAIGVKISHGVTMHGLALNVNTDLSYFSNINPCGFVDKGVTSMACELGREISVDEVGDRLGEIIVRQLSEKEK